MLDLMRKYQRSWLIYVMFGLIIIVFVAWGGFSSRQRRETDVARVGSTYITGAEYNEYYNNLLQTYKRQLGPSFSEELIRGLNLKKQARDNRNRHVFIPQGSANLGFPEA